MRVRLFLHEKRGIGRGVLRGNSAAAAAGGEAVAAAACRGESSRHPGAPQVTPSASPRRPSLPAQGCRGHGRGGVNPPGSIAAGGAVSPAPLQI